MTTALVSEVPALADAALTAVSELTSADLSALDESSLLDLIRTVETLRRKIEAFDNVTIPELEARGIPARYVLRGTSQFVAGLLNLAPSESAPGSGTPTNSASGCSCPVRSVRRCCPNWPPLERTARCRRSRRR